MMKTHTDDAGKTRGSAPPSPIRFAAWLLMAAAISASAVNHSEMPIAAAPLQSNLLQTNGSAPMELALFPLSPLPQDIKKLENFFEMRWETGSDYPYGVQDSAGDILYDSQLISLGGYQKGLTPELKSLGGIPGKPEKYIKQFFKSAFSLTIDKAGEGWKKLPDFPGDARQGHFALAVNNQLYVWGGFSYVAPYTYADGWRLRYDAKAGNWVWDKLPDLPVAVTKAGIAAIGSKIYIMGGASYNRQAFFTASDASGAHPGLGKKLWVIDTENLAAGFQALPDLPGSARWAHSFTNVNGKLYALAGTTGTDTPRNAYYTVVDNWSFDPVTEKWRRIRNFPLLLGNAPDGNVVYKSRYIFIVGGYQYGYGMENSMEVPAYGGVPFSVFPDHKLYSNVLVYDTEKDIYGHAGYLPITNNQPMLVVHGDTLHMIGGETGRSVLNGVYYGHHPDLYLKGHIVDVSRGPDLNFPQVNILYPFPGESVVDNQVKLRGTCNPGLGAVLVVSPPIYGTSVPAIQAACKQGHYEASFQSHPAAGHHIFRVEQHDNKGQTVREHQVSLYFP